MRTRAEANRQRWAILGFAVAVLLLSVVLRSAYYELVLTQVLLWAVLSLAWNILSGYSGYFSFGHAAFWGLGAYTVVLGMVDFDLTPWLTIPFCAVVGAAAGALIGYPTFRLRGHYFALAMLAYPLATLYVFAWLGYQEVTLPMKRESAWLYMQFDDPRIYVERFISPARHVEVQVLGDGERCIHLHERECSLQRQRQKVFEETPAPGLAPETRTGLFEAAIALCDAIGYRSAGTVESLVDAKTGEFFFIEMNTRIQVEHPVTELVTGVDLVAEQLRIAAGEPLRLKQADVVARGCALELRINAEDPVRKFMPNPKRIARWVAPAGTCASWKSLASVTGQNERLAATLREARDQIVALKEEVDRLAQQQLHLETLEAEGERDDRHQQDDHEEHRRDGRSVPKFDVLEV